jgi:hypothetical protein
MGSTLLTGAISPKMFSNNEDLKRMLCPLLDCHLKHITLINLISKKDKSEYLVKIEQHPLIWSNANKILQNEKILQKEKRFQTTDHQPFTVDNFLVTVMVGLDVSSYDNNNAVSGVVWSTRRVEPSNKGDGSMEYWLTTEDMHTSKFLIAYFSHKTLNNLKGDQPMISYQVNCITQGILSNGIANFGKNDQIHFSRKIVFK